jgi:phage-related protein
MTPNVKYLCKKFINSEKTIQMTIFWFCEIKMLCEPFPFAFESSNISIHPTFNHACILLYGVIASTLALRVNMPLNVVHHKHFLPHIPMVF